MSNKLEFIFDFGSPNAYLSYKVLAPILERTSASLEMTPCLLGGIFKTTGNQPPMIAFENVKGKTEYEQKEMRRFIEKHGLTKFRFNPNFPVNTIMLMRGAILAQMDERLEEYVEAGMKQMWENGLKMDDPDVYASAMNEAGFSGSELLERMQDTDVKNKLIANTQNAVDRGCFGAPTFFVGEEMFFGKDRLDQVEAELCT